MSDLWLTLIPTFIIERLGPLSLLLVGYLVEKNFIGRIPTFTNVLAINLYVYNIISPNFLLVWYANIGLIFAVIAITSYKIQQSLPQYFYYVNWAYSSIAVGFLMLVV